MCLKSYTNKLLKSSDQHDKSSDKPKSTSHQNTLKPNSLSLKLFTLLKPNTFSLSKPTYADKLGKDGRLTQKERQWQHDNNLCIFCGTVGYIAKDCWKASFSLSKAKSSEDRSWDSCTLKLLEFGKIGSSSQYSVQAENYIVLLCVLQELKLNTSALSDLNFLHIPLSSSLIPIDSFSALLDSGFTHCFIDSSFSQCFSLPTSLIHPVALWLFDGTSNTHITQVSTIPVMFPSGECIPILCYVTLLDSSVSVVLRYDWLICYNLLIDWVSNSITFQFLAPNVLIPTLMSLSKNLLDALIPEEPPSKLKKHNIFLINAATSMCAKNHNPVHGLKCNS